MLIKPSDIVKVNEVNQYALAALAMLKEEGIRRVRFLTYEAMLDGKDLYELELSQRAFNSLRRVGISTVGELASFARTREDLLKIRNLGMRTAIEIQLKLFLYQYELLSPERRAAYLTKMVELSVRGSDDEP